MTLGEVLFLIRKASAQLCYETDSTAARRNRWAGSVVGRQAPCLMSSQNEVGRPSSPKGETRSPS